MIPKRKKVAVMVSGGLDSYIAYEYALTKFADEEYTEVIPVYIRYGSPYQNKEDEAVDKLFNSASNLKIINADLATEDLDNVPTLEKGEIYGRNLLMLFYGGVVGDIIWLASLETEMNPTAVRDKHPEFMHMCSAIFSYVFKSKRFETVVETPFKDFTKSDIVDIAINDLGITIPELMATSTCYHEEHHNCGKCSTCFKRWVAMINNGIEEEDYVDHPYTDNEYAQWVCMDMRDTVNRGIDNPRYSDMRLRETHNALLRGGFPGIYKAYDNLILTSSKHRDF